MQPELFRDADVLLSPEAAELLGWAGWSKSRGRPWRQVCVAELEAECWKKLLENSAHGGTILVLPAGRHPNDKANS